MYCSFDYQYTEMYGKKNGKLRQTSIWRELDNKCEYDNNWLIYISINSEIPNSEHYEAKWRLPLYTQDDNSIEYELCSCIILTKPSF